MCAHLLREINSGAISVSNISTCHVTWANQDAVVRRHYCCKKPRPEDFRPEIATEKVKQEEHFC